MNEAQHIVCPHCDATNRIPPARPAKGAKCGSCNTPLFTERPLELTGSSFRKHISRNDIPVVVDFWAPWCGPCKMMAPAFEQASGELEPQVRLAKLNTENEHAIAAELHIQSIPTIVVFKNGQEIARQSGAMGASDIVRWVDSHVLSAPTG